VKRAAAVLATIVAALATAGPADAATTRVTTAAYAHPGGTLELAVRASRGRATVALSADRRLSKKDIVLTRRLKLRRGKTAARETVPAATPPAVYRVVVCKRHRCGASARVHVTAAATGTRDLTDAAVAAHHLSASRAIVYRVWAAFGDRRLPARFRGDVDVTDDTALDEALGLRGRDRRRIDAYLQPPTAWLERSSVAHAAADDPRYTTCGQQATTKHWSVLTGRHVRVWWWREHRANRNAAAGLVRAADRTIWPAFQKLMGRRPPSAAAKRCAGGNGRYDIYLLPKDVIRGSFRAVTLPYAPPCSGSPSFTEFNTRGGEDPPTRFELAHELFHAFQFAFKLKGDCAAEGAHRWLDEATAVWASTWLYPHEEGTHERVPDLALSMPFCSIDSIGEYEAFPYVLEIQQRYGIGTVPAIYRAYASTATPLRALDAALPGGFAATWRTFTRDAFNDTPVGSPFVSWYGIATKPLPANSAYCGNPEPRTLELHGAHAYRTPIHLAGTASVTRRYDDLHFGAGVRAVTVRNHTAGNGRSDLQALLQLTDGSWKIRDLSSTRDITYCLADQHIQRIVLAYGDHSIDNSESLNTRGLIPPHRGIEDGYAQGLMVDVRDSCATFLRVTALSGSVDYSATYPSDGCTVSGTEHGTLALDPAGHSGATDGRYENGTLSLNLPARETGAIDYTTSQCTHGPPPQASCHTDVDEAGGPIASAIGDAGAPSLDVEIGAWTPHLYFFCPAGMKDAGSMIMVGHDTTAVSTSALTSGQPLTVTWDATHSDGQRSTHRVLSVTATPTNEDGGPLNVHPDVVEGKLE
jgi:hypothetical protein